VEVSRALRECGGIVDVVSEELREYSEDGVDLTLIRWMLSLTPRERFEFWQNHVNAILAIREFNARD
jgi:hypothetical protein